MSEATRAVRTAATAFFPLDEQLDLPSTALLPHAHETLVRLGAWMPFERAANELKLIMGIQVSAATVRRQTEEAGRQMQAVEDESSAPHEQVLRTQTEVVPPSPERLALSSDGAMVSLRGGLWAEVKTLVIGEVQRRVQGEEAIITTTHHSYFARLTDAERFADLASGEVTRRGVAQAHAVCAVQDGAPWLQTFVDSHRSDAVRILDFAHAAGYLGVIAGQRRDAGCPVPTFWLASVLHELKHHGPDRLIRHLQWLSPRWHVAGIEEALRYFGKRLPQMQYPTFQQQGWPIGSGMVECANKIVMQARLKGAGMHWHPDNVNAMLALRSSICNDRWQEQWHQQRSEQQLQQALRRQQRAQGKRNRLIAQTHSTILRLLFLLPRVEKPRTKQLRGRTEAQKRWGRQTFSLKAHLKDRAKK